MGLQLNEEKYKEFEGIYIEQMPKVIAEGRRPMSVSDIMQRRLEVKNASGELKNSWWGNSFSSVDAVAYHPDGRVKILLNSPHIINLNSESIIKNGYLILPGDIYNDLQGQEVSKECLEKIAGQNLSKLEIQNNPIWQILAKDQELLERYTTEFHTKYKHQFGGDFVMRIYLDNFPDSYFNNDKFIRVKSWTIWPLNFGACLNGGDGLSNQTCRLVGNLENK